MEDDEQEELERVTDWIGRLEAFAESLDDLEGESARDFANNACTAFQATIMPSITPGRANAAVLMLLEAASVVTRATRTVLMDWADTPDVRDRYTRESAQQLVKDALDGVLSDCKRWLSDAMPSSDQIRQRVASALAGMKEDEEALGTCNAELDAQDAEAEADPYGAILFHADPSRSDAPILEKVCSFTEDDHKRYRDAYEQLRRQIDSELLQHISDEYDRFSTVLAGIKEDLRANTIGVFDEDAWDERRRRARSALISFTMALQVHQEQTINAAKRLFGRKTPQLEAVEKLFKDLRESSFEYGWLEELRDALQHGDINAFKYDFTATVNGEPTVNVYMDRGFMLQFTGRPGNKTWLKRDELRAMISDPNLRDMIEAIRPLMGPLQEKLDIILYPDVANDAATVRELIGRFERRSGTYAMQTGPGFTRRKLMPPLFRLAPRVLHFAQFVYTNSQGETVLPQVIRLGAGRTMLFGSS
ncbi:hypothetical protein MA5S0422_1724 [Mycobacteroides abscessus 5S-0422]|uniref:Uncharacterized protein n=1 Tax=Mycobacteroides abscessus subsp. bolletii 1513 TaxID=1299321 RepID=X8DUD0_9MYCO|nr:hypothetical protein [Mycobacteroides abscessus]EUA71989.1 hypothetical protein I540_1743 [Mycobacteroides abscessus subsp. bolletii 1513]EIU15264.1 hypothetical protein MA5S0304_0738 [Mycobacteroides abscessus 5S-0304]EIU16834.1 hypothetical protein MA5S0421_0990 [Mycobacteroides abscessus 5S-0421]EIU18175.1 hypothetical protein MA5S0422_1724 [Mycobacteroides abscessus 5S-0422]EIU28070.1 hypothetical protein MA5S0708_1216 [Mycobacteroides abscessus 5S-0708]